MDEKVDFETLTKRGRIVATMQTWDYLAAHVITSQYRAQAVDRRTSSSSTSSSHNTSMEMSKLQMPPQPQTKGGAFARKRYELMCQLVNYPSTQEFDQPIDKAAASGSDDDIPESEEDLAMTWDS